MTPIYDYDYNPNDPVTRFYSWIGRTVRRWVRLAWLRGVQMTVCQFKDHRRKMDARFCLRCGTPTW